MNKEQETLTVNTARQNTKEKTNYKVGDVVRGDGTLSPGYDGYYTYEVLKVKETERFNQPAQLLTVNVYASYLNGKTSFVEKTTRWAKQLF